MPSIPDAELPDQSWMKPDPPKQLPVAPYSEFNPPPLVKESAPERDETIRHLRKALIWFAIAAALLAYAFLH